MKNKFRVWDKTSKRFLDENDNVPNFLSLVPSESTGHFKPMYMEFETSSTYDADLVIMRYIGTEDKNGKELYEGDIFNTGENTRARVVHHGYIDHITTGLDTDPVLFNEYLHPEDIVIIGNIYEDPELLEFSNE